MNPQNGEPWWIAKDVCDALEMTNVSDALLKPDEDEKASVGLTDMSSLTMNTNTIKHINESGLYELMW